MKQQNLKLTSFIKTVLDETSSKEVSFKSGSPHFYIFLRQTIRGEIYGKKKESGKERRTC